MAVNNEYVNRVDANGQTLIDLTNDTATAGDVLEGRTLHLASGAPATGTYRPSDEIEARLEATVGHSSKNLLKITGNNQTVYGVEFVVDATAGTITAYNESTSTSQNNSQYNFRGDSRELIEGSFLRDGLIFSCEGLVAYAICAIAYYNDSNTFISDQQLTASAPSKIISIPSGATKFRFYVRKRKEVGSAAVVFAPMLRDDSISDDTFEPYVTPTDERIEPINRAYLEATVGHSAINLFEPKYRQGTSANTTTANAVCSLTVIPTEYGKTHIFRKYNSNFSIRIYGTNDEGKAAILSGGVLTQNLRLYEGSYVYDESWTHTNKTQGVTCYVIMVRKPNFTTPETYQNITPSDVPSNLVMVTDGSISDDTFEPYVTPTDEKKQDKPVLLWEGSINLTQVATLPVIDVREDYDKLILRFGADTTYIFEVSIDTNFNNSFPSYERTFSAVVNQTLLGMYVRYGSANMVTFNYLVLVGPDITTNTIRLHEIYGIPK